VILDSCNINETNPRIANIVENQVLVYYNAERLLQYFGSTRWPLWRGSNVLTDSIFCRAVTGGFLCQGTSEWELDFFWWDPLHF